MELVESVSSKATYMTRARRANGPKPFSIGGLDLSLRIGEAFDEVERGTSGGREGNPYDLAHRWWRSQGPRHEGLGLRLRGIDEGQGGTVWPFLHRHDLADEGDRAVGVGCLCEVFRCRRSRVREKREEKGRGHRNKEQPL